MKKTPKSLSLAGNIAAGSILLLHFLLSVHAARHLSPTWDEVCYPATGFVQLATGALQQKTYHPPLGAFFYGLALTPLAPSIPLDKNGAIEKSAHRFGFDFIFSNRQPAKRLIFWSRMAAIMFSLLTAFVLFIWARSLAGLAGGLFSLACYALTPLILSRAPMTVLEMPMLFFLTLSSWLHFKWFETSRKSFLITSAVTMGFALASKMTALPILGGVLFLEVVFNRSREMKMRWVAACSYLAITALVFVAPFFLLTNGIEALRDLRGNFSNPVPYFWRGEFLNNGSPFLTWAAMLIKAPLGLLMLGIGGAAAGVHYSRNRNDFLHFLMLCLTPWCAVLLLKYPVSTVQLIPLYIGLAGLSCGWGIIWPRLKPAPKLLLVMVIVMTAVDVFRVHPNYLSYFNVLAGGPERGHYWLSASDHDWGQSLPALRKALDQKGEANVILSYSGAAQPEAYGIFYQDLFSPALTSRIHKDAPFDPARPTLLAVADSVHQSYPEIFEWLDANRPPSATVSFNFKVWNLTGDAEAFKWLAYIYAQTGRDLKSMEMLEAARGIVVR